MKKTILIVNNNMQVGGVQKSLYNLLWSLDTVNQYDVTLFLFCKTGEYVNDLPPGVKVEESKGFFRYLGKSQSEFRNLRDALVRGLFALISRLFGRTTALKLMLLFEPIHEGTYDYAISFLHNGRAEAFYGGTQDYVLNRIKAKKKIAFLHCDYNNCGANNKDNNRMMAQFDAIAACSDGCRAVFESALPHLKDKCVTVRNCHRYNEIKTNAGTEPQHYDSQFINVITVARLSHEKAIDRGIKAVKNSLENGIQVKYHIVGGGSEYEKLLELTKTLGMENNVVFYSEQSNPYRFMKNADLFLLTSYHEAAPMVIDEAVCLGLPVLTTQTTSSQEMVTNEGCGWVCENSQEALNEALFAVLSDKNELKAIKSRLLTRQADNSKALAQFGALLKDQK